MRTTRRTPVTLGPTLATLLLLPLLALPACKEKETPASGLVSDAATAAAADTGSAAVPVVDPSQCPGCQLAPTPAWTFEGIYRDAECTDPLAQLTTPACAAVSALGAQSVTYVDEIGGRKANETAAITLGEQVGAGTLRYRKTNKGCVRANESATNITPLRCDGQRVCRDASGALACAECRTFASGCADFEETRMYATINDPAIKAVKGGGGGNRFAACCGAIVSEAKRLGSSPEAGVLMGIAAQCNALVAAAGPNGNAPELAAIKGLLAGRKIPGCQGL